MLERLRAYVVTSAKGTTTLVGINTNTVLLSCSVSQASTTSTVTYASYRGKTPYIGENFSMGGYSNSGNNNTGVTYFTLTGADSGAKTVTFTNAAGVTEPGGLGSGTSVTAPGYALDVAGDVNCSGYFRSGGTAGVTHAAGAPTSLTTAGGIVTAFSTSDERQKKDITPFTRGLDALRGVQPINFRWNEKSGVMSDHAWVGFSAQNVQKTIPEAVPCELENGMLDFNHLGVLAAAVNAIKELEAKVLELESRLKEKA